MDKVLIYVKVIQPQKTRSEILQVFADPSQNGCHLRQRVARLSGQCPSDFRLIFAGKEITDAQVIQELDIAAETLIHAVPASKPTINEKYGNGEATTEINNAHSCTAALTDSEVNVRSDSSLDGKPILKPRFYLFCKNHCLSVQPGKLRVRCTLCKDDAFLVAQDPDGWNDVMLPGRISGTCLALECHGEIAEFYFKCVNHTASSVDKVTPLPLIKTNLHRAMCITCAEVLDPVFMFPCTASHVVCLECFSQYCQIGLDERRFTFHTELGYTLPCPAGCEDSLIPETHHFLVLGKEQYTRYKRFGAEECLLQIGGVLCPSPGCGAGILPDFDERRVICQREEGFGCGFVFCRECYEAYHEGECNQQTNQPSQRSIASTMNEERQRHARWELEESKKTIEKISKPCPKCRVPVERSGGCMHMTCSRAQCKYEWCWICGTGWNTTCLQDHWFGTDMIW